MGASNELSFWRCQRPSGSKRWRSLPKPTKASRPAGPVKTSWGAMALEAARNHLDQRVPPSSERHRSSFSACQVATMTALTPPNPPSTGSPSGDPFECEASLWDKLRGAFAG